MCQDENISEPSWLLGPLADAFWGKGFLDCHVTASPDRKKT